jgi:hypothetical protein
MRLKRHIASLIDVVRLAKSTFRMVAIVVGA